MNTYNINDTEFINSSLYQTFLTQNPSRGILKIRAYAANGAVPISGLRIIVSKQLNDDNNVIFFDGLTDSSGIIDNIVLPAPKSNNDNLVAPSNTTYLVTATNNQDNINQSYQVGIYENLAVLQNIVIVPTMMVGEIYGR